MMSPLILGLDVKSVSAFVFGESLRCLMLKSYFCMVRAQQLNFHCLIYSSITAPSPTSVASVNTENSGALERNCGNINIGAWDAIENSWVKALRDKAIVAWPDHYFFSVWHLSTSAYSKNNRVCLSPSRFVTCRGVEMVGILQAQIISALCLT